MNDQMTDNHDEEGYSQSIEEEPTSKALESERFKCVEFGGNGDTRMGTRNEERGTRNEERGTRNEERGAFYLQYLPTYLPTYLYLLTYLQSGNEERRTTNGERGTGHWERGTGERGKCMFFAFHSVYNFQTESGSNQKQNTASE